MKKERLNTIDIDIKYKQDSENWNKLINLVISLILENNNYEEYYEKS